MSLSLGNVGGFVGAGGRVVCFGFSGIGSCWVLSCNSSLENRDTLKKSATSVIAAMKKKMRLRPISMTAMLSVRGISD